MEAQYRPVQPGTRPYTGPEHCINLCVTEQTGFKPEIQRFYRFFILAQIRRRFPVLELKTQCGGLQWMLLEVEGVKDQDERWRDLGQPLWNM